MTIRVLPEAEEEAIAASDWYDGDSPGMGDEFGRAVRQAFQAIENNPLLHPVLDGGRRRSYRACLLNRFSYMIVYEIRPDEITIVAISHVRRKPFYWTRRK